MQTIDITDAELGRVRDFAMQAAGISIPASKKALIVGRWGKRLAHHGMTSFGAYLTLLSSGKAGGETQIALDLLTTNETSFFREPKHFDFLRDTVLRKLGPSGSFRAWSAACSSGEEPYSIAMLLAATIPRLEWDVLGTDISTRVLATAEAGLYDMTRSTGISADYLQRFCLKGSGPQAGKFLIHRSLRDRVSFRHANLNERLADFGRFDVILLRNVMIYFDAQVKARVVGHLVPALKPGALLIIGHCDTLTGVPHGLTLAAPSIYMKSG